jgi:hypothetical protein
MMERELNLRAIGLGVLAIAGGIALALIGAWLLLRHLGPADNGAPPPALSGPQLQTAPQPERAAYFAAKEQRLGSYGWVDRRAGMAHIPLEDAMRLAAVKQRAGGGWDGEGDKR